MLVKATKQGFIYGVFHQPGDKFTLVDVKTKDGIYKDKDQFSRNWMEVLPKPKAKSKAVKKPKDEA